jgi:AraC family transcriptional activator of pobA
VNTVRFVGAELHPDGVGPDHRHAHDFLVLTYFDRGGGSIRLGDTEWQVRTGDVFVVPPGQVIGAGTTPGLEIASAWAVLFPHDVIDSRAPATWLSWRSHPLLFPFVAGATGGAQRLHVPEMDRQEWVARCTALEQELRDRGDGYRDAVLAHLTLLLIAVSRLAANVVDDLVRQDQPLLAAVFDVIETRFTEPISLRDVARSVNRSPGHLTTIVRDKTGRTVQQWINERRMVEARRLLLQTDLTVSAVASRVGFLDAGYFIRTFRQAHDLTPGGWRSAAA